MKRWLCLFILLPLATTAAFGQFAPPSVQSKGASWSSPDQGGLQSVDDPVLGGKAYKANQIVGLLPFDTLTNPGDKLTIHFNFRLAGPITATNHGFKLGVFEGGEKSDPWFFAAGTGYRWNISTGPYPIPASLVRESGGAGYKILGGQDSNIIGQSQSPISLNDTAKHTAILLLAETGSGLNLSLAIDGKWTFQCTDLLPPSTLAPTRFAIRSDANTFLLSGFTSSAKASSN